MFNGLKRGFQLIADTMRHFVRGITQNNTQEISAAVGVARQFLAEVTDTAGNVKGAVLSALVFGGDPMKESRVLAEALNRKFPL